ncbi:hypothetical protein Shyhy01_75560 [Streptomyces hygroscopicus subsp. hygroscopicus]|nr:hypothetical protein Shyhy01_75560 [Streptomyces hygroscopicus subsp. hygroscopicus]
MQVLARLRSDRVLRRAVPLRRPGTRGRPRRHGGEFVFGQPDTRGTPDTETVTDTRLYGTAAARSWNRFHPRLTHRSSWDASDGTLPIVEETVIRLAIDPLPRAAPKPAWLWWSGTDARATDTDRLRRAYLRRSTAVADAAGAAADLAQALPVTCWNLGIAAAASGGGLLLDHTGPYARPWSAPVLLALALTVTVAARHRGFPTGR